MSEYFPVPRASFEDLTIAGPEVFDYILAELDSYQAGIKIEDLINLLQTQYKNWFDIYYAVLTTDGVENNNGFVRRKQDYYS